MENQQPNIWACQCLTFFFATGAIAMRFFSRRLTGISIWWDDWLALAGYFISITWMVLVPIWISHGLGMHYQDITDTPLEDTLYVNRLLLFIAELLYAFALFFGKASILMFYWRMFSVTNIKLAIRILMGCAIIWIIVRTFMGIWHCVPIQAFWDDNAGGHCAIDDPTFFLGTLTVHIILDVAILAVPIVQIQRLRLPALQRLGVMVMFMFGIFICIAAAVIIHESRNFDAASPDFTWNISVIIIWATVEVNLVVVSTCLPILRPSFNFIIGRKPTSHTGEQSTSGAYSRGPLSNKKSIKLSTMAKHEDSSSTYQLADSVHAGSSSGDFDDHASDARAVGHHAFVSTRRGGSEESDKDYDMEGMAGVMVKNETTVRVSRAKE